MRFKSTVPPHCTICGQEVTPEFSFDVTPTTFAHPDCFAYTHSDTVGTPSRVLPPGTRPIHLCGDELCVKPEHMV